MDEHILTPILLKIRENVATIEVETKLKMSRKLNNLYKRPLVLPTKKRDAFVNLSSYELSEIEKEFLNLGLNCHIQTPVDQYKKKVELELLYENLLNLQNNKVVDLSVDLRDQLRAVGSRSKGHNESSILTPELKKAAKSLRENPDIVVRRADKSTTFVILNREDYREKIKNLLSDASKFKKITKNPCEDIKKKVNNLIDQAMIETGKSIPIKKITGDFSPGYIYGNVKTHKEGERLRPIISQIPTPTYGVAKQLDNIIKKYLPQGRMLKSSTEFVDLLNSHEYAGNLFSLDVESLFTNIPVKRTINIILEKVYNNRKIPPPVIPKHILEKLLLICTTEVPFRDMDGKMYQQCDGMSMGSPLGPTFANFFMAEVENRALSNTNTTPSLYCRYIDDIFVICELGVLLKLKEEMVLISGLNFTVEESVDNKLPFLNVMIEKSEGTIKTKVYRKPTDVQMCLNGEGECPDRYKQSVVRGFLYRAKNLCSEQSEMMIEISRSKQILINNGYTNKLVDNEIRTFLKKNLPSTLVTPTDTTTSTSTTTSTTTTTTTTKTKTKTM